MQSFLKVQFLILMAASTHSLQSQADSLTSPCEVWFAFGHGAMSSSAADTKSTIQEAGKSKIPVIGLGCQLQQAVKESVYQADPLTPNQVGKNGHWMPVIHSTFNAGLVPQPSDLFYMISDELKSSPSPLIRKELANSRLKAHHFFSTNIWGTPEYAKRWFLQSQSDASVDRIGKNPTVSFTEQAGLNDAVLRHAILEASQTTDEKTINRLKKLITEELLALGFSRLVESAWAATIQRAIAQSDRCEAVTVVSKCPSQNLAGDHRLDDETIRERLKKAKLGQTTLLFPELKGLAYEPHSITSKVSTQFPKCDSRTVFTREALSQIKTKRSSWLKAHENPIKYWKRVTDNGQEVLFDEVAPLSESFNTDEVKANQAE